jgi:cardiolipin synthase
MPRLSICVDGDEFGAAVDRDIRSARNYVFVQTLSFEGDRAGKLLADAMISSRAEDRRIIVDSFTKYVISDRFLYTPGNLLDRELRNEVRETREMMDRLRRNGVGVQFVRPMGLRLHRLPIRDHKKSVIIDDAISYVGGINLSEHNFSWHDLMLRIRDDGVAGFLRRDFLSTWDGFERVSSERFDGLEMYIADGRGNESIQTAISERIERARERIYLECPYVMEPFFQMLHGARRRGVDVTIVTPEANNRIFMKAAIMEACERFDLRLRLTRNEMTHVKAMLVDDDTLVLGSTNFDYVSFKMQPEIMAIVTDADAIREFKERVMAPGLQNSTEWDGEHPNGLRRHLSFEVLRVMEPLVRFLNRF